MKKSKGVALLMLIIMSLAVHQISAQLSGNNLVEFQWGNIPKVKPQDYSALYDQVNLQYRHNQLTGGIKFEQFMSPQKGKDYFKLTQYRLNYKEGRFDVDVGHFYETFGRGILLRTYDIKGSVYEGRAQRIKHGFYKNIHGVAARYKSEHFRLKAVRGRMLSNQFPPGFDYDQRWANLIEGLETVYSLKKQNLGISYIRSHLSGQYTHFASLNLNGSLPAGIVYYTTWAQEMKGADHLFQSGKDDRYAFYLNVNYSYENLGILFEFKDYKDFLIGTGVNEPPALVKEHGYKLLNRSTHIPQLIDESGFQAELYYFFPGFHTLTFNVTRLENELFEPLIFSEYFLEWDFPIGQNHQVKSFIDYGKEEITLIDKRLTTGMNWNYYMGSSWNALLEIEYQQYERGVEPIQVNNYLVGLSTTKSGLISAGLLWEWSDNPDFSDNPETLDIEKGITHWPGMNFTYWYKDHTFSLFAGKRRGGPACSSGICYEVLDFQGIELRIISNF